VEPILHLGVLDQSPIPRGKDSSEALVATIELAQMVEEWGYERFWVAEHHSSDSFAGPSPEILMGQIAAKTNHIQVGSGGVMLTHYSSLKVAEQFSVMSALYPNRIELGLGRAPGSDQLTAAALAYPKQPMDVKHFPQQVLDVLGYLNKTMDPDHPFARIKVLPGKTTDDSPDVWLLGSSDYSARLAASLGLSFAFADFFGDIRDRGPIIAELYRNNFEPSQYLSHPKLNVTVQALCAETAEKANHLGSSRNLNKAGWILPEKPGLLPPNQAASYVLTPEVEVWLNKFRSGYLDGDPEQVKSQLMEVAKLYETDHINIVTITYDYADRARSYELIAEAFGLRSVTQKS